MASLGIVHNVAAAAVAAVAIIGTMVLGIKGCEVPDVIEWIDVAALSYLFGSGIVARTSGAGGTGSGGVR